MKYQFCILFFLFYILTLAPESSLDSLSLIEEEPIQIKNTTKNILHRYYFITRLQKNIKKLQNLLPINTKFVFYENITLFFSSQEIIKTTQEIEKKKTLEPLWELWNQITSYKKIDDARFEYEFTQLFSAVIHSIFKKNNNICILPENNNQIGTTNISYNFYLIKRLDDIFQKLNVLKGYSNLIFLLDAELFTHKRIIRCKNSLQETKNILSLLELIEEFKEFKYCSDMVFMREFLMLLLSCAKQISAQQSIPNKFYSYHNLSIEELLYSIDIVSLKFFYEIKK